MGLCRRLQPDGPSPRHDAPGSGPDPVQLVTVSGRTALYRGTNNATKLTSETATVRDPGGGAFFEATARGCSCSSTCQPPSPRRGNLSTRRHARSERLDHRLWRSSSLVGRRFIEDRPGRCPRSVGFPCRRSRGRTFIESPNHASQAWLDSGHLPVGRPFVEATVRQVPSPSFPGRRPHREGLLSRPPCFPFQRHRVRAPSCGYGHFIEAC